MRGRLGATVDSQAEPFELDGTVYPVTLVDSDITLSAIATAVLLGVPASAGELIAPAINTRLANTGALAAGNWTLTVWVGASEGNSFRLRRRNALDVADVWSFRFQLGVIQPFVIVLRVAVAQNEFFVVENVVAGTAGIAYQAAIFAAAG